MSVGNVGTLVKNAKQIIPGMMALASSAGPNMASLQKFRDRQWNAGPQDLKDQAEMYDTNYWKRGLCQHKNMWVDKELNQHMTRDEIAKLMTFKMDSWKVANVSLPLFLFGGYAVPFYSLFLGNDLWQPSTVPQTPEALAEWRQSQDLQRYKYCAASVTSFKWWLDFNCDLPKWSHEGWEEMFEKNDVRRDPVKCASASKMYECFQPFHLTRRLQARQIARAMNIPTFPYFMKINLQTRIRDYWDLALNEDYMVISGKLQDSMTDEELQDYAWRRFLAPYDKNLDREQLLQRINDYHAFLGPKFVEEGKAPNLLLTIAYCMQYYADPAYQTGHIEDLEANDFEGMAQFTKDAYMQRLEFENGRFRDQVEAHSHKVIAERDEKRKALAEGSA